jgi:hypothetical protein
MSDGKILKFPPGFLWGTATSPTQVEGHIENEWTNFTAQDGGHCRIACDHYHRYPEDIEWMSKLSVNAYRFGIEWSRLQSAPFAPLNQNELARYVDLLDRLKVKNITPMVVLHHFSNPPWINSIGGWTNAATVPAFVDFVRQLVAVLKEKVFLWNTFNEPDTYACVAYLLGGFPPQRKWKLGEFRKVISHMARAHVEASRIIQREGIFSGRKPEVGIAKNWTFFHAYKKFSPWDLPLHVQQICAGRFSWRRAAQGFNFYRAELLWPRALSPFSRNDSRQRHAGENSEGFWLCLRRHGGTISRRHGENPVISPPEIPAAGLHHGTRRGLERRGFPRARPPRKPRRPASLDPVRCRCARIFLLVAAGQLRVAVWLLKEIWPAGRGFRR